MKNALEVEYDGIKFKSKTERAVYIYLSEHGYHPLYEPDKIVIATGFRIITPWYRYGKPKKTKMVDITYTPDFRAEINGRIVYFEVKGFETDVFPIKRKLFLKKIQEQNASTIFAQIHSVVDLEETIRQICLLT